jgi:hypothetical protein
MLLIYKSKMLSFLLSRILITKKCLQQLNEKYEMKTSRTRKLFPMVCRNEKENNVSINNNFKKIGCVFI